VNKNAGDRFVSPSSGRRSLYCFVKSPRSHSTCFSLFLFVRFGCCVLFLMGPWIRGGWQWGAPPPLRPKREGRRARSHARARPTRTKQKKESASAIDQRRDPGLNSVELKKIPRPELQGKRSQAPGHHKMATPQAGGAASRRLAGTSALARSLARGRRPRAAATRKHCAPFARAAFKTPRAARGPEQRFGSLCTHVFAAPIERAGRAVRRAGCFLRPVRAVAPPLSLSPNTKQKPPLPRTLLRPQTENPTTRIRARRAIHTPLVRPDL
jgi:hypothetical protein